jgi:hypothetical protein
VTSIDDCRLLELPTIARQQGKITPVEAGTVIPFEIQRVYFIYDVTAGASRGGHAHRELEQLIVATMGEFSVRIDDGRTERTVKLNRAHHGLYVPRLIWRELIDFSSGGVCVVLASLYYHEADYIRDYDEFAAAKRAETPTHDDWVPSKSSQPPQLKHSQLAGS